SGALHQLGVEFDLDAPAGRGVEFGDALLERDAEDSPELAVDRATSRELSESRVNAQEPLDAVGADQECGEGASDRIPAHVAQSSARALSDEIADGEVRQPEGSEAQLRMREVGVEPLVGDRETFTEESRRRAYRIGDVVDEFVIKR